MDIRTEIKNCRVEAGLSKRRLAQLLRLHETFIYKLEMGEKDPSLTTLREMAHVFREHGHPFSDALEQLLGVAPVADSAA